MATYLFKNGNDYIERRFPMGECPSEIKIDDRLYKRVYTVPNISFASKPNDDSKIQEEIDHEANELGMRGIVPLKRQSKKRQLQDLKMNKTKFRDSMDEANEKSVEKMRKKQKSLIENRKKVSDREMQDRIEKRQAGK